MNLCLFCYFVLKIHNRHAVYVKSCFYFATAAGSMYVLSSATCAVCLYVVRILWFFFHFDFYFIYFICSYELLHICGVSRILFFNHLFVYIVCQVVFFCDFGNELLFCINLFIFINEILFTKKKRV